MPVWRTNPRNLSLDFPNILYFCRYVSQIHVFLSVLFADICICPSLFWIALFLSAVVPNTLYDYRYFPGHMYFCRYCFWTSIFLSVILNILYICRYFSVSSGSEHSVYLPILLKDTSFCRVDVQDVSISLR